MWNLRNNTDEYTYKTDTDIENKLVVTKGRVRQIRNMGLTDTNYHIKKKKISNKDILFSTGNYTPYLVITYNEI